ncbi:MAG: T9SS type A sorting domain-containing protein [Bacteroidetes bacterium]|nr:T9SS type A sorting domain-containing protein [Bacteroidota bacterium]
MKKTITHLSMLLPVVCLVLTSGAQDNSLYYQGGELVRELSQGVNPGDNHTAVYGTPSLNRHSSSRVLTEINFDDKFYLPCAFASVDPLQGEYEGYGVIFGGPTDYDGGALLDECSGFAVTGYSPPNYLAFNTLAVLSGGGIPKGPEDIYFDPPVAYVEILAGSSWAGIIDMFAYDEMDNLLDSDQLTGTDNLQLMSVTGERIAKVTIQFSGNGLVLDNLVFDTYLAPDDLDMVYLPGTQTANFEWKYATMNGIDEEFLYDANNWIPVTGEWTIDPGAYVAENQGLKSATTFYNYNFSGFDLEVKMKKSQGSDCNAGIYFHGDPSEINNNGNWMNGYHLIVCNNGNYNIVLYENGSYYFIQAITFSANLNTGAGSYNTVRIIRDNGYIEVFFNGFLEGTWYDDTYNSGKIGLKLYDDSPGAGKGYFDYVKINPVSDGYTFQPVNPSKYRKAFSENNDCADCSSCTSEDYTLELAPYPPESQFTFTGNRAFQNFNFYMNGSIVDQTSVPSHSLSLTDFMLYSFYVTARYDEGESNQTNYELLWIIENPLYTQTPYNPANSWAAFSSDANKLVPMTVYDNFTSTENIYGIEFFGINLKLDGSSYQPCNNEDPMDFLIKFYEDDAGTPGAEIASFSPTIERIETNVLYTYNAGIAPLFHYRYYLTDPVVLNEGWVSVQATSISSPDCIFFWMSSPEGDGIAYQSDGIAMILIEDVSFAILGESSVGIIEVPEDDIRLYPNPVSNRLYIESNEEILEITIYNHLGQEIYHEKYRGNNVEINTSDFSAGLHMVSLSTGEGITVRKVIVQ